MNGIVSKASNLLLDSQNKSLVACPRTHSLLNLPLEILYHTLSFLDHTTLGHCRLLNHSHGAYANISFFKRRIYPRLCKFPNDFCTLFQSLILHGPIIKLRKVTISSRRNDVQMLQEKDRWILGRFADGCRVFNFLQHAPEMVISNWNLFHLSIPLPRALGDLIRGNKELRVLTLTGLGGSGEILQCLNRVNLDTWPHMQRIHIENLHINSQALVNVLISTEGTLEELYLRNVTVFKNGKRRDFMRILRQWIGLREFPIRNLRSVPVKRAGYLRYSVELTRPEDRAETSQKMSADDRTIYFDIFEMEVA